MKVLEDQNVAAASPQSTQEQQLAVLLTALTRLRKGDADVRMPLHWPGLAGRVAELFNEVVELNANMALELARLQQVVGKEGKLKQRGLLLQAPGFWGESIECVNSLID